jgi:hypothetical protein
VHDAFTPFFDFPAFFIFATLSFGESHATVTNPPSPFIASMVKE